MATSGDAFDQATLEVSDDSGSTYNEVAEVTDFNLGLDRNAIDFSNIDSPFEVERKGGKRDSSPSITANYIPTDTGQAALRAAYFSDSGSVRLRFRPKGSGSGNEQFVADYIVTGFDVSGTQGDKNELSVELSQESSVTRSTQ